MLIFAFFYFIFFWFSTNQLLCSPSYFLFSTFPLFFFQMDIESLKKKISFFLAVFLATKPPGFFIFYRIIFWLFTLIKLLLKKNTQIHSWVLSISGGFFIANLYLIYIFLLLILYFLFFFFLLVSQQFVYSWKISCCIAW